LLLLKVNLGVENTVHYG